MKVTRFVQTGMLLSTLMIVAVGCGSSSSTPAGSGGTTGAGTGGTTAGSGGTTAGSGGTTAGSGGTTAGSGGTTAGSGGATGSGGTTAAAFTAVAPCAAATDYTTTGSTITFGGDTFVYSPKCLKVAAGTSVTFMGNEAQMFSDHPLMRSTARGTTTGNPIPQSLMTTANMTSISFPTPGFYAYYCGFHGVDSDGTGMAGVVWVE